MTFIAVMNERKGEGVHRHSESLHDLAVLIDLVKTADGGFLLN
jgi:hypothetical protein